MDTIVPDIAWHSLPTSLYKFGGSRRVIVRLRRLLPPGTYRIEATGRRADGTRVRTVRTVRRAVRRASRS